ISPTPPAILGKSHEHRSHADTGSAYGLFVERRHRAAGLHLGTAGHREVVARSGVRDSSGTRLRFAARKPARTRGPDRRAADHGWQEPVLSAGHNRTRRALLPISR